MSDDANHPPKISAPQPCTDSERTKQVSSVGWTVGLFAMFGCIALINQPTWPVAVGVSGLGVMVTAVGIYMLKK